MVKYPRGTKILSEEKYLKVLNINSITKILRECSHDGFFCRGFSLCSSVVLNVSQLLDMESNMIPR